MTIIYLMLVLGLQFGLFLAKWFLIGLMTSLGVAVVITYFPTPKIKP